jgi:tetratricopeptide (TPR) repeat protein
MDLDRELQAIAALYEDGDLATALRRARELVDRRPGMRMALMELAHLERESGNLEAAIDALGRALALRPADPETIAVLSAYLVQAGKPEEAVAITDSHAGRPDPVVDVLLVRALALARANRGSEALAAVEKAHQVDPRNAAVPVHLGTLQLMAGDRDRARAAFQQALALNPDTVAARTALGVMEAEDGNLEASVEHWRRATAVDDSQYARLLAFGTYLWERGQIDRGRPLLELFMTSAPADRYREELDRLRELISTSG